MKISPELFAFLDLVYWTLQHDVPFQGIEDVASDNPNTLQDESAWVCGGRCLSRLGFGRIRFRMIVTVASLVFDRRDVVDGAVKAFGCWTSCPTYRWPVQPLSRWRTFAS